MTQNEVKEYLNIMKEYNLAERVFDITRSVMDCIGWKRHFTKSISKPDLMQSIGRWGYSEFGQGKAFMGWIKDAIPDETKIKAKLLDISWMNIFTGMEETYYIWLFHIRNGLPYDIVLRKTTRQIYALCGSSELTPLDSPNNKITVGLIAYGDSTISCSRCRHIITHEVTHYVSRCIINQYKGEQYKYSDEGIPGEIRFIELDELVADIVPYYVKYLDNAGDIVRNTLTWDDFMRDLPNKFSPYYITLYETILPKIVEIMAN